MIEQPNIHRAMRILFTMAALAIISLTVKQAQATLAWFLFAAFLSVIGTPLVLWLERKRIPYVAAALLVVAGFAAVLVVIGALIGASLNSFYADLPSYQTLLQNRISSLQAFLAAHGITITDSLLIHQINTEAVKRFAVSLLRELGSALFEMTMILILVMFIFLEASSFSVKIRTFLGEPQRDLHQFMQFIYEIQRYMNIKTVMGLTEGVLIGAWLSILGVDFPVMWGFLAFLLHYVPNVGGLIAAMPAVLLAFIEFGTGRAVQTVIGYLAVEFILGNVAEPMLLGRKLGLSTLVIIVSMVIWGSLLGIAGAILCVPLTMTLKFVCGNNQNTRWIAVLLGSALSPGEASPESVKGVEPSAQ